jgi:diguanylate cyclase (GGDEF)-like protein
MQQVTRDPMGGPPVRIGSGASSMTVDTQTADRTARAPTGERVLVLNHRGDPLPGILDGLRQAGFEVVESGSIKDTQSLLAAEAREGRAAIVVLNPVVLKSGGVELELVKGLQREGEPVPVILLVDSVEAIAEARRSLQLGDFLLKPPSAEELVHRVALAARTRERFQSLYQKARDLAAQVTLDFKTGLLSERHFKHVLQVEFKRAQRHHLPLSLLLVDVDNFKRVNDSTEYRFGDEVLREVARVLKDSVRATDFAARFGGDEFVLLLPHTTPVEAVATAMRIRQKVSSTVVANATYQHQVTVSIGIDTFDGRSTTTVDELSRRANKALQEAKRRGKDQVWLYSERIENGPRGARTEG